MPKPIDMALEILQETRDGEALAPHDLSLLQSAVNDWLTEAGEVAFYDLYARVKQGYIKPWFHGIEHLTITHVGYVYWKGVEVEHYTPRWAYSAEAKQAAQELARRCRIIEARGETPGTMSAVWNWEEIPA